MSEWYIANIGFCADCGVGHICIKNGNTGEEKDYQLEAGPDGTVRVVERPEEEEEDA